MDPIKMLQNEILNLRKELIEKEAMLKQHMNQDQVRIVICEYNNSVFRMNFVP
jgi:hypothetical protein